MLVLLLLRVLHGGFYIFKVARNYPTRNSLILIHVQKEKQHIHATYLRIGDQQKSQWVYLWWLRCLMHSVTLVKTKVFLFFLDYFNYGSSCTGTLCTTISHSIFSNIIVMDWMESCSLSFISCNFSWWGPKDFLQKFERDKVWLQIVPKFSHWVMDVRFLKVLNKEVLKKYYVAEGKVTSSLLLIGLGNNSICLWDTAWSHLLLELKCTERCLLYSMSLWGDSVETLHVASGTIYNEILIWKIFS